MTVTEHTSGTSYTVQAGKIGVDAVHQPVGPAFAGMHGSSPGPWTAWKVLLKPTKAGGNYTLFAQCTAAVPMHALPLSLVAVFGSRLW